MSFLFGNGMPDRPWYCLETMRELRIQVILIGAILMGSSTSGAETPRYQNPDRPVDERVTDLLDRMTLEEKVAQLLTIWEEKGSLLDDAGRFAPEKAAREIPDGLGHFARPSDRREEGSLGEGVSSRTPTETVELVNALQRYLVEETRLGIPAFMHEEGLHGFAARDATHFPQAIALASTWDPELVEKVYTVVAREIRVRGPRLVLTPVVDVARDPRWGRIEETYGEDPFLVSEMGLASVRGFQGDTLPLAEGRVLATLKHMTGHGQPESGTNIGPANISERILREVFFPPFERAVREGGAQSVMASYNEIDGVPSHVNRWLLDDVLRGEWGFQGMVVADYEAINQLVSRHQVAESPEDAAVQALTAGVDAELPDRKVYPELVELVRQGVVDEGLVDKAVSRNLRLKFLAGLFEDPYADAKEAELLTGNKEARELALLAAERAIILLKNDSRLLPLDLGELERIAVIGPNAKDAYLGGYSDEPRQAIGLLEGIATHVGDEAEVGFAPGVVVTVDHNWFADEVVLGDEEENHRMIQDAADLAATADVAIVAVGGNEMTSREAWAEGHLGDRDSLDLVGQQEELVRAIVETGTPTVVVLVHGRPLSINYIAEAVPAILDTWYLGQEAGTAIARTLFGEVNPGGKLPVTIPRAAGQLPHVYNHKPTARRGYLFADKEPLWPFGFGLSYTAFRIAEPRLQRTEILAGQSTTLSVEVVNSGDVAGDEVVQLYIRDRVSSVTRPVKELKGFQRVHLEPGESRTVTFEIGTEELQFYGRDMQRVVEPGDFELMVGPNSRDVATIQLSVVKE